MDTRRTQYAELRRRIKRLEEQVADPPPNTYVGIMGVESRVQSIEARIRALEEFVAGLDLDIQELVKEIDLLT